MPQAIAPIAAMAAGGAGLAAAGGGVLATLSSGLMLAGGALGTVGLLSGSKKLAGVGNIISGIGGIGTIGAGMFQGEGLLGGTLGGAGAAQSATSQAVSAAAAPRSMQDFERGFLPSPTEISGATPGKSNFATDMFKESMIPDMARSLKRFDTIATLIGGVGAGYLGYEENKVQKRALDIRQQQVDLEKQRQEFEMENIKKKQQNQAFVPQIRITPQSGLLGR